MRAQSTESSCGPAALRNALLCLGIKRSEEELEQLCGTTTQGTHNRGILRALDSIAKQHPEVKPGVISETRPHIALLMLLESLRDGHPVIVCTSQGEHWATAFGLLGAAGVSLKIHVSDSDEKELVLHYTPAEFVKAWEGTGKRPYYGIIV